MEMNLKKKKLLVLIVGVVTTLSPKKNFTLTMFDKTAS